MPGTERVEQSAISGMRLRRRPSHAQRQARARGRFRRRRRRRRRRSVFQCVCESLSAYVILEHCPLPTRCPVLCMANPGANLDCAEDTANRTADPHTRDATRVLGGAGAPCGRHGRTLHTRARRMAWPLHAPGGHAPGGGGYLKGLALRAAKYTTFTLSERHSA